MRRITILFVAVLLAAAAAGCGGKEHEAEPGIRTAELRGEAQGAMMRLDEAVHRAAPFCDRMEQIREHGTWLFEEGWLATHLQYRNWWFECKRTVPELIEPGRAAYRALKEQVLDLDPDTALGKDEAARVRRLIARGNESAVAIANAVHLRNRILITKLEPALKRYPMPAIERRLGLPPADLPGVGGPLFLPNESGTTTGGTKK